MSSLSVRDLRLLGRLRAMRGSCQAKAAERQERRGGPDGHEGRARGATPSLGAATVGRRGGDSHGG
jgi:hypothetical protein